MKERLQKLLAQANIASRRASEDLITRGRVRVNGVVAHLGDQADPDTDVIEVDGTRLNFASRERIFIALNKPQHVLTTDKPHRTDKRQTVMDFIDRKEHLFSIGRLDADSEGLVVMTNDGETAQRLSHPRYRHSKTYRVDVFGLPTAETLAKWSDGIFLEEGKAAPCFVEIVKGNVKGSTLRIVMTEGKKRQIRRVASALGHPVQRLLRTHIGMYALGDLTPGATRILTAKDILALGTPAPEIRLLRSQSSRRAARTAAPASEAAPEERRSVRVKPTASPDERRRSPRATRAQSPASEAPAAEETNQRRTQRTRSSDTRAGSDEARRTPRTRASDSVGKRRAPRIARPDPPAKNRRPARSASATAPEGETEQRRPSRFIKPDSRDGSEDQRRSPRAGRSSPDEARRTPRFEKADSSDAGSKQRRTTRVRPSGAPDDKRRSPRSNRPGAPDDQRRTPRPESSDTPDEQRRPPRATTADAGDEEKRPPRVRKTYPPRKNSTDVHRQRKQGNRRKTHK